MRSFFALLAAFLLISCTSQKQRKFFGFAEGKVQVGSYAEAADMFRRGIALNPESTHAVKALYRLGFLQEVYLRDYEPALISYHQYLEVTRDSVAAYEVQKRLANIFYEHVQNPEKSIIAYRKLQEIQRDSLDNDLFQYRIARSQFLQNNFSESRNEYQALIEKYPKSQLVPKARFEVGTSYFVEEKYSLAIQAFKQVLRFHAQHPQAVEAQFWIAQGLEQLGDVPAARRHYEQLKMRYPTPAVIEKHLRGLDERERKRG